MIFNLEAHLKEWMKWKLAEGAWETVTAGSSCRESARNA